MNKDIGTKVGRASIENFNKRAEGFRNVASRSRLASVFVGG